MAKVNISNVERIGPGTLIQAYDKIDKIDPNKLTAQALELQFTISHELEKRGWELDEEDEWVFYLEDED